MEKTKLILKPRILVIFVIITVLVLYITGTTTPTIDRGQIKSSSLISYQTEFNYRQTANDCGPFNVAAVVRALKNKGVDSNQFANEIKWRLPNEYTLPRGLKKQLKQNKITVEIPNLKVLSDEDKIHLLRQQLSQGKPIIILGEINGYEHYITIFGFDASKNEFYVYDSAHDADDAILELTKDDNSSLPGNKTLLTIELLDFWRNGGMYGIYNWYAIIASI